MSISSGDIITDSNCSHRKDERIGSLWSRLEAVILILIGLGAAWFAAGENYGLLMAPKFRWVTLGGASAVFAMGVMGWYPVRRTGFVGSGTFLLLLAIILIGRPFSENSAFAIMSALRLPDAKSVEDPNFPLKDIQELQAELEEDSSGMNGLAFSALGTVKRLPPPNENGEVALMRSYMVCCAADALALGFRVDGDAINAFKDSDWVVVRGTLAKLTEPDPVAAFRLGTATFSIVNGDYVIEPVEVVALSTTLPSLIDQLGSQNTAKFTQALQAAGLLKKLEEKGPFTVFAPINEAFDNIGPYTTEESLASEERAALRNWLSRHLIAGRYLERDLFEKKTLHTIDSRDLPVRVENGRLFLGNSRMLLTNIEARNGVIHIIYPSLAKAL